MSGTQIMGGGIGLGWGRLGAGWGTISGLGELAVYPAVAKLQRVINGIQIAAAANPATMQPFRTGNYALDEDGRYGNNTASAARQLADWLVRQAWCSRTSFVEVDRNGPNAMRDCLMGLTGVNRFTSPDVDQLQRAWTEWKASLPPPGGDGGGDLDRQRRECAASGGTWNEATRTCTPPSGEAEGMGTGMWILLALIGAVLAYGVYYVATES